MIEYRFYCLGYPHPDMKQYWTARRLSDGAYWDDLSEKWFRFSWWDRLVHWWKGVPAGVFNLMPESLVHVISAKEGSEGTKK